MIKDELSAAMALRWSQNDDSQPAGFMNFPQAAEGMYGFTNFYEHFESEHRLIVTNDEGTGTAARWVKKQSNSQNHMWDCRVYNLALRDIIVSLIGKEIKQPNLNWAGFVATITGGA